MISVLWLAAGCGGERICLGGCTTQSVECRDFLACLARTQRDGGELDPTYGPHGTCWGNSSRLIAKSCTDSCASAILSLRASFPDAGCL